VFLNLDIASIPKLGFPSYTPPPPSIPPPFGQVNNSYWEASGSGGSTGSSSTKSAIVLAKSSVSKAKLERRKFGQLCKLESFVLHSIDDLDCLTEIGRCMQASSKTLRVVSFSLATSLVQKSKTQSSTGVPTASPLDDDAMTEPNTPNMTAQNSAPNEADLRRERLAQEQTLARIFGTDTVTPEQKKNDKRVEKSLKTMAKSVKLSENETDMLEKLAKQLLKTWESHSWNSAEKTTIHDLLGILNHRLYGDKKPKTKASIKKKTSSNYKTTNGSGPLSTNSNGINTPWPNLSNTWESFPTAGSSTTGKLKYHPLDHAIFLDTNTNTVIGPTGLEFYTGLPNDFLNAPPGSSTKPLNYEGLGFMPESLPVTFAPTNGSSSQSNAFQPGTSSSHLGAVSQLFHKIQKAKLPAAKKPGSTSHNHTFQFLVQLAKPESPLTTKISEIANKMFQNPTDGSNKDKPSTSVPANVEDSDSDTSSESNTATESPIPPNTTNEAILEENSDGLEIDVDMEHPDVISESGDEDDNVEEDNDDSDSEIIVATENTTNLEGKGKSKAEPESKPEVEHISGSSSPLLKNDSPSISSPANTKESAEQSLIDSNANPTETTPLTKSTDETIKEYIRMTHGFTIRDLTLSFIPLKPSVLAKALDLSVLRSLTLLNVGSQGAFWTMVSKYIEQGAKFDLSTIHTDDVSPAFVNCLGKLEGVKTLHLLRRSTKEVTSVPSKTPATLEEIQRIALSKHLDTLQALSITNHEDEAWDLNDKVIKYIAAKGKKLSQLAFSIDISSFVSTEMILCHGLIRSSILSSVVCLA
jgi:hypothetical protein